MKQLLSLVLMVLVFDQFLVAQDMSETNHEGSGVTSMTLQSGKYIVDFRSDLDLCMTGEVNLTAFIFSSTYIPSTTYAVSSPVESRGLMKPAVCIVGYNEASAFIEVYNGMMDVRAPEGYEIKRIRKISQTVTVTQENVASNEVEIEAGEYVVKIGFRSGCYRRFNFAYGYTYGPEGIESVDVFENEPVGYMWEYPRCIVKDSEAIGTVYIPRGRMTLKTKEGSSLWLSRIEETIILFPQGN